MNAPFSSDRNDDDLFLDVQIEHQEISTNPNSPVTNITSSAQSSSTPFVSQTPHSNKKKNFLLWKNITKRRLDNINRKYNLFHNEETVINCRFPNLEPIKTKIMIIAITFGMLPLILSSGVVYYFGNQAIKQQQLYTIEQNYDRLEEYLNKQQRILLFLLAGTEITAILIGLISLWWTQRVVNSVAGVASQTTSLTIKAENQKQSQILADFVANLRQSINIEDILTNAVTETRKILKCDRVIIYQFESQGTGKAVAESVAPLFSNNKLIHPENLGLENIYLSDYQKKQGKVINNIYCESELSFENLSQYESLGIKSCLHAPIEEQGELSGLLIAYQCSEFRTWKTNEIKLFNQMATEVGLTLDDAQIVKEFLNLQVQLQENNQWQDYLNHSLKCIHSASTEVEIIKIAVEETHRVLKSDRAVFCRLKSVDRAIINTESATQKYSKIVGTVIETAYFQTKYYSQNQYSPVQVINNVETAKIPSAYQAQLKNLKVKSLIVVPIIYQHQLYGFLMAHQCSWQRAWQKFEKKWFKQFAQQIGYSLDKSKVIIQEKNRIKNSQKITKTSPKSNVIVPHQLPAFLEESKLSLEKFSQKVIAEVDAVTPVFKQMQIMAKSVEGLTYNINQTKLQSQQVDGILRREYKNIDLTEDRLIDIQQTLKIIVSKNNNLGQSCQQFIQATKQIPHLAESIDRQVNKTNAEANRMGIVSEQSLQELTQIIQNHTGRIVSQVKEIGLFLREINEETQQITTCLEKSEAKAFVSIEIVQETRQNLNQLTIRNQEINQLIGRIALAATVGEQNAQLAQQSLLEVANLANQAAKKSLIAVSTIAGLIKFLEKS